MRPPLPLPTVLAWLTALLMPTHAGALTADSLRQQLEARLAGDRTGVCVQVAVISPEQVLRDRLCAQPRPGREPAADAAFEIGSISKTMTAFLVADLVAAGRWTLDDPIARHLPEGTVVPRQGERQILVRDLLSHSAALPPLPPGWQPPDPANPYAALSEAQLLQALGNTRLIGPIGSRAAYSNFGAMVLSLAVARAQGGDLVAALRGRLFQPLGMAGAHIGAAPDGVTVAPGHTSWGAPTAGWTITPALAGVGMVRARLDDMVAYAQAHLGLLSTPLAGRLAATQAPLAHGHGMAWLLGTAGGRQLVSHAGATGGYRASLVMEPATRRAVVLLADSAQPESFDPLALQLLGLPVPPQRPRLPQPLTDAQARALEGRYLLGSLPVRVYREGDRLMAQAEGQPPVRLLQDSRGDLYTEQVEAHARPIRQGDMVVGFVWFQGGGVLEAWRDGHQPPATAQHPLWRQWAGEYRLAPGFSLRVFEREGTLQLQATGQPAFEVEVTGDDRIEVKRFGAVLQFNRNAQGVVDSATLLQQGRSTTGARAGAPAP
jgi:serine-type D-Ala-D-Ala carboxypeptidase/endopeptidase